MKGYTLTPPTFPTQQRAFSWAWQVARTSQLRCRVGKQAGRWRVWRAVPPSAPGVDITTTEGED